MCLVQTLSATDPKKYTPQNVVFDLRQPTEIGYKKMKKSSRISVCLLDVRGHIWVM